MNTTIDITPLCNAVIALVCAIVSAFIVPWIKSKGNNEKLKTLTEWVKIAVNAAEQIYNIAGCGKEKKQYVLDFLKSKGYSVDSESVSAAIEAEVRRINSEGVIIQSVSENTEV